MTKGWKNSLRGLSGFRRVLWLSGVEEKGCICVSRETSTVGSSYCRVLVKYVLFYPLSEYVFLILCLHVQVWH